MVVIWSVGKWNQTFVWKRIPIFPNEGTGMRVVIRVYWPVACLPGRPDDSPGRIAFKLVAVRAVSRSEPGETPGRCPAPLPGADPGDNRPGGVGYDAPATSVHRARQ